MLKPATRLLNGIDLYYTRGGSGELLLLLHGGGGAGVNWNLVFPEPPEGFELVVPDLRGHGHTANPEGAFTFRQCALDVLALLDHLGVERVKAIGVSMGAKTLLHMATREPDRIDSMVLVSAAPYFPEQARAIMRTVSEAGHSEEEWRQMREWHIHGDEQIRALWRMSRAFADSYNDMAFTPPLLSTITARTLLVHGDRDPLYPAPLAMEMYEAIPNSALWIIPNAGHSPIYGTRRSELFAQTAVEFLHQGDQVSQA